MGAMNRLLSLATLLALLTLAACRSTPDASSAVGARPEVRYYVIADT